MLTSEGVREADGRARDLLATYPPSEALDVAETSLRSAITPTSRRLATMVLLYVRARVTPC
jgi:hypothetical protein